MSVHIIKFKGIHPLILENLDRLNLHAPKGRAVIIHRASANRHVLSMGSFSSAARLFFHLLTISEPNNYGHIIWLELTFNNFTLDIIQKRLVLGPLYNHN